MAAAWLARRGAGDARSNKLSPVALALVLVIMVGVSVGAVLAAPAQASNYQPGMRGLWWEGDAYEVDVAWLEDESTGCNGFLTCKVTATIEVLTGSGITQIPVETVPVLSGQSWRIDKFGKLPAPQEGQLVRLRLQYDGFWSAWTAETSFVGNWLVLGYPDWYVDQAMLSWLSAGRACESLLAMPGTNLDPATNQSDEYRGCAAKESLFVPDKSHVTARQAYLFALHMARSLGWTGGFVPWMEYLLSHTPESVPPIDTTAIVADFSTHVSHAGRVTFDASASRSSAAPIKDYLWTLPRELDLRPAPQIVEQQSSWSLEITNFWERAAQGTTRFPVGLKVTDTNGTSSQDRSDVVDLCRPDDNPTTGTSVAWDIRCYERELGEDKAAGEILSSLRQRYYGGPNWNEYLITCEKAAPVDKLDNEKLDHSLRSKEADGAPGPSARTQDGDVPHVLAGLDAAQCPDGDFIDNLPWVHGAAYFLEDVPNWHMGTWLGDLASAVAARSADIRAGKPRELSYYFGDENAHENVLASNQDLLGDIDALVLHFAADGQRGLRPGLAAGETCDKKPLVKAEYFSQPDARLSQLLNDYYSATGPVGQFRLDRRRCIGNILGVGVKSNFDREAMKRRWASAVEDAAYIYYVDKYVKDAMDPHKVPVTQLSKDAEEASRMFADWLRANA